MIDLIYIYLCHTCGVAVGHRAALFAGHSSVGHTTQVLYVKRIVRETNFGTEVQYRSPWEPA